MTKNTLVGMRRDRGFTQKEMAERMGVSQSLVSRIETEIHRMDVLQQYISALGGSLKIVASLPGVEVEVVNPKNP